MMDDVGSDAGLPSGTVSFLLTDVEGSTRLWERDAVVAAAVVARHRELIAEAVDTNAGGRPLEQGEGDNVVAVFARATDAVRAAAAAQRALGAEPWPEGGEVRVRMAIHTGEAEVRDDGTYAGAVLNRCARLRALAHGGQVLVSSAAADLVTEHLEEGTTLVDLGVHRLRDLSRPELVWELRGPGLAQGHPPLRSLDALPNNLPVQLSSFVGREEDIAQGVGLLDETRLLTLTGAGGCGKTRLAQRVAGEVADRFPGGTWWVELAPLGEGALVSEAVAGAIGVRVPGERDAAEVVADHLSGFPALVVLDNCEHLVADAAAFADRLLRACAGATVLATSREPLAVEGEVSWRVPSLAVPPVVPAGDGFPPDALAQFDAVRLFIDRAVQVRPNFRVDNDNAPAVAQICARLDGIPLAIELAAARVRSLPPERIASELDDRFRLLAGGNRAAMPRQQTLQASVDWSHELLDAPEQALFRRLSAFADGFELDAAETVAAGPPVEQYDVLDVLDRLVDKSLVQADERPRGGVRYRLLETIRQYGLARLEEAGEAPATKDRHFDWVWSLVARHRAGVTWAHAEDLDALDTEHPNIRAALDWALSSRPEDALRLVGSLGTFWAARGHYVDAATVLPVTLAMDPSDPGLLAQARWARAYLRFYAGDVLGALDDAALALQEAEVAGDGSTAARSHHTLGSGLLMSDPERARRHLAEAVTLARGDGDEWCEADAMQMQGFALLVQGAFPEATEALERSIVLARRHRGAFQEGWHHSGLGVIALHRGDLEAAEAAFTRAAAIGRAIGDPAVESFGPLSWGTGLVELGRLEEAEAVLRPFTGGKDWGGLGAAQVATLAAALGPEGIGGGGAALFSVGEELVAQGLGSEGVLALGLSAVAALDAGDLDAAAARAQAALGHHGFFASAQYGNLVLAAVARCRGAEDAEDLAHEALAAAAGKHAVSTARSLALLGGLAMDAGSFVEGVRLLGAADQLSWALGRRPSAPERAGVEADVAAARAALDAATFDAAWAEGAALPADEAVGFARRARGERGRPSSGWASLTPTEEQVVELVSDGLTNPQVAERLLMGRETVKTHLTHVFQKLGVTNRTELAMKVAERRQGAGPVRTP